MRSLLSAALLTTLISTSAMAQGRLNVSKANVIACYTEARGIFHLVDLQTSAPGIFSQQRLSVKILGASRKSISYKVTDRRAEPIVTTINLNKAISGQNSGQTVYEGTLVSEASSTISVRCIVE